MLQLWQGAGKLGRAEAGAGAVRGGHKSGLLEYNVLHTGIPSAVEVGLGSLARHATRVGPGRVERAADRAAGARLRAEPGHRSWTWPNRRPRTRRGP